MTFSFTDREQDSMELRFCLALLFTAHMKGDATSSVKTIVTIYDRDMSANWAGLLTETLDRYAQILFQSVWI